MKSKPQAVYLLACLGHPEYIRQNIPVRLCEFNKLRQENHRTDHSKIKNLDKSYGEKKHPAISDAIFYFNKAECQWATFATGVASMWQTVYQYFRR